MTRAVHVNKRKKRARSRGVTSSQIASNPADSEWRELELQERLEGNDADHQDITLQARFVKISADGKRRIRIISKSSVFMRLDTDRASVRSSSDTERRVICPPAFRISEIGKFLLTKRAYASLVEPHIADIQWEYIEAIGKGDEQKAKWIVWRGRTLIIWSVCRAFFGSLTGLITFFKSAGK